MLRRSILLAWLTCVAFIGCAAPPDPISNSQYKTFGFEGELQVVTLGPGDVVSVRVLGHPELSATDDGTGASGNGGRSSSGNLGGGLNGAGLGARGGATVDRAGYLHLPLLDRLQVNGLELPEVKAKLEAAYGEYLKDVNVAVDLLENRSNRYYVLGHVREPGAKVLERSMTAMEAASTGGYFLRGADKRHIFVLRAHPDGLETHEFNLHQPGPGGLVQIRTNDIVYVRQRGVDNFQEDWLPIFSSLGITALTLSRTGVTD